MTGAVQGGAETRSVASRVVRNTSAMLIGDLVAKLAGLGMYAALTRRTGAAGLGMFVFAWAWAEITVAPVDMGFDRYFLRRIAHDREEIDRGFFNILRLKLLRAVPALAASFFIVWAAGFGSSTRTTVMLLTGSFLFDGLTFTVFAVFTALERAHLRGATTAARRLASASLGVCVLLLGSGVAAVAAAYLVASILAFALALGLLTRQIGFPARTLPVGPRRDLRRASLPFAAQELLSVGFARLDVLLLAALATQTVVGYYGAAYRLLEATLFIPGALQTAFAAMYTYLDHGSLPSVGAVFGRSIKLLLILLAPAAIALELLPGPLLHLLFGAGFGHSITPLRLLAPTVIVLGIVLLCGSLIASRLDPRIFLFYFAVTLAVNLVANLALIPPFGAGGAAAAMLIAESVFAALALRISVREVRGLALAPTFAGALVASGAMAATLTLLRQDPAIALVAGLVVYGAALAAAERRFAASDFAFVIAAVRRRLRGATALRQRRT